MSEAETIGPYEVVEQIARDSTGRVVKATDPENGRTVAIKLLPPEFSADEAHLESFREQVEAVSQLDHPHVVRILDSGEADGRAYFVMEWIDGMPLSKLLKRRRLSLPEAFGVFKSVALALAHAHSRGVLHHDLNPRNVLVTENLSTVKLGDFGISRAASMAASDTVTSTSVSRGSLNYLAPEQATSTEPADQRADIYALGVLLHHMLTGSVPVGRFTLPSRVNSEVPAEVDPLVLKCLEGNPAQRYASVDALLRHTEQLEDRLRLGLASELRGLGRSFRLPTTQMARHKSKLVIAGVVVALAAAGFAAWSFRDRLGGEGETEGEPVALAAIEPPGEERPPESFAVELDDVEPPAATEENETGGEATSERGGREPSPSDDESEAAPTATPAEEPSSAEAAQRLYEQAAERARSGRPDEALATIDQLRSEYPRSRASIEALFLRARIEESRQNHEAAMATYTEIGSLPAATPEERATARYRFAKAVLDSSTPNARQLALGVFDEVARAYPETDYAPLALAAKATLEEAQNIRVETERWGRRTPAAFLTWLRLIEDYPDHPNAERAFWIVGTETEDRKEWELAADAYWQLATRFPETRYDAWWKAGQILDRRLDQNERAISAYQKVPVGSEHYEDAQKRIARLSR
ncbi:MAG: protein kinase [Thermoanaerobaculia bacterium]|nr:protein kinase [Thermoanaerobaculia bacterium]